MDTSYLAGDLKGGLQKKLAGFDPDVVGISITAVTSDTPDSEPHQRANLHRSKVLTVGDSPLLAAGSFNLNSEQSMWTNGQR